MKKPLVLTGVGLTLLGFYLFSDTNIDKINKPINDTLSTLDKNIPEKIEANGQTLSLSKNKELPPIDRHKKIDEAKPSLAPSQTLSQIDRSQLLELVGATDSIKWQTEYSKGIYEEKYDLTWQDDMYNRSYQLIYDEKYSEDLSIKNIECKNQQCDFKISGTSQNHGKGLFKISAMYMNDLKNHPAILHSGKKRNLYIRSINISGNGEIDFFIK